MRKRVPLTISAVITGIVLSFGVSKPPGPSVPATVTAAPAEPVNYVLTTATTPVGTPYQDAYWETVQNHAQGVDGFDPVGNWIFDYPANRSWVGRNWYPNDSSKLTLCGRLDRFEVYDGWGAELDWNSYIIPAPHFAWLLEEPKAWGSEQVHDCAGGVDNCMEAELTPDDAFEENPFFSVTSETSSLVGRDICTYGPWVNEEAHGNRPEIHPSELIWWKEGNLQWMMLLQDDSNRFDRTGDYSDLPSSPPSSWRPWSAVPRSGEFRIAFELNPANERVTIFVNEMVLYNRNVVTNMDAVAKQDSDDGSDHAIEYNGQIVLKVIEGQPDDDIGVRFVDVVRNSSNNRLRGYVALRSKVGKNDRGEEGYDVIVAATFKQTVASPAPKPPTFSRRDLSNIHLRPRLVSKPRRKLVGGQNQVVADLRVPVVGRLGASSQDTTVSQVTLLYGNQRQELTFEKEGHDILVRDIPLNLGYQLQFKMASGKVVTRRSPGLALAPYVTQTPQLSMADASAWPRIAKVVGGGSVSPTLSTQIRRVRQWRLEVAPFYAPSRRGEVVPEDDSPASENLNDTLLKGNANTMAAVFGSPQPHLVEWSFKATNLTTGKPVAVNGQNASTAEVRVDVMQGKVANGVVDVTFPTVPAGSIYEVVATAQMSDVFGVRGEVHHRVWSHILTDDSEAKLAGAVVPTAAALAGVPVDALVTASKKPIDVRKRSLIVADMPSMRARMVRNFATRSARDQLITLGELRTTVNIARRFQSP